MKEERTTVFLIKGSNRMLEEKEREKWEATDRCGAHLPGWSALKYPGGCMGRVCIVFLTNELFRCVPKLYVLHSPCFTRGLGDDIHLQFPVLFTEDGKNAVYKLCREKRGVMWACCTYVQDDVERENRECNKMAIRFEMGMKLSLDVMNKSGIRKQ